MRRTSAGSRRCCAISSTGRSSSSSRTRSGRWRRRTCSTGSRCKSPACRSGSLSGSRTGRRTTNLRTAKPRLLGPSPRSKLKKGLQADSFGRSAQFPFGGGSAVGGVRRLRRVLPFEPATQPVEPREQDALGDVGLVELIADFPLQGVREDDAPTELRVLSKPLVESGGRAG